MIRVLIISDLHAYTPSRGDVSVPSFLLNSSVAIPDRPNPLQSIPELLEQEGLDVDWVLCPGDISDKANPDAQTFAWQQLKTIKDALGASALIGTAGNHDIDSRLLLNGFDPKGHLQSLSPAFPGIEEASDKYWARNFHILINDNVRLLNLNSSAFHGYHSDDESNKSKSEYRHGRVSVATIDQIKSELKERSLPINILLTHHHLYKNDHIYAEDYSEMVLGGRLVRELTEITNSSWLIIHGHQHYPELRYGPGTVHVPVIFSAGSVSAVLESPLSSEAANQFYHVTLETDQSGTNGWTPCGVVRAWHWAKRSRWERSPHTFNIPYEVGFGCREQPSEIAKKIASVVIEQAKPFMEMREVFGLVPYLRFLLKETMDEVLSQLPACGVKCIRAELLSDSNLRKIDI
jgi:predicted phosphodiesterase